jgi:L-cystine uptake protein TcyP (sodium:dicarboxylate symporter family)
MPTRQNVILYIRCHFCYRLPLILFLYRNNNKLQYFKRLWEILLSIMIKWYCVTNRKVAGSIPDDVIGIFH